MPARDLTARYGTVAMTFHWVIAALVLLNLYFGLTFDDYPKGDPTLLKVVMIHKSIGLTVLVLSVLRLGWRLVTPIPPLPASMGFGLRFLARTTHSLLYFLIIAIPLSGWIWTSSSPLGLPIRYFGLFDWPLVPYFANLPRAEKIPLNHNLHELHMYLAWSALLLIALHVSAALYHHFVRRDDVLRRMIPGTTLKGME